MIDTFGSDNTQAPSLPGQGYLPIPYGAFPIPGFPSARISNEPSEDQIAAQVARFTASLPNDPPALIRILKGLIKERLDTWGKPSSKMDREPWDQFGEAVLAKYPRDFPEYKCYQAWKEVYYLAASNVYYGLPEQKAMILKKWAAAEKICPLPFGGTAAPPTASSSRNKMPPLAPPRSKPPLDNVFNPTSPTVSPEFKSAIEKAWQELPTSDKNILSANGVKINIVHSLNNDAGSPGIYDPSSKQISVGQLGAGSRGNLDWYSKNVDPAGTLKHEVGHALYGILHLNQWDTFQSLYNKESSNIPNDGIGDLAHFLGTNGPNETFAELYAGAQGRSSARVAALRQAFPELSKLVESTFSRNR